ncbi:ABC transporter ATP-binding protein [Labrys wisconsinensis]|nr:ABC transporter ATP-binding protein [Labrys wisconsinensis]
MPQGGERGAAIDIRNAVKRYGGFTALDDVSLHIEPGEFMTLLGPSGSGKTTTLNVVAGFTDLTSGDLALGGRSIAGLPAHKRNIGVVFQHYALFPHMTVGRNVAYPLVLRGLGKAEREARVRRALDMVKMTDFAHRFPSELSGGQQQRVALARAMVFDPPLLLMDEPLGALDKKLREWLQLEIKRIHRELGTTFVYVTHDQEEALVLSDRIAVFNQGRIEQVGTGRALYDEPATLFVGRFIGESTTLRGAAETSGGETCLTLAGQRVLARDRLADGRKPVILLRPERLSLAPAAAAPAEGRNGLAGRVSEAIYLGSGSKYQVTLRDGSVAVVRTPPETAPFAIGDEVSLSWSIADSKLLADDDRAELTLT